MLWDFETSTKGGSLSVAAVCNEYNIPLFGPGTNSGRPEKTIGFDGTAQVG